MNPFFYYEFNPPHLSLIITPFIYYSTLNCGLTVGWFLFSGSPEPLIRRRLLKVLSSSVAVHTVKMNASKNVYVTLNSYMRLGVKVAICKEILDIRLMDAWSHHHIVSLINEVSQSTQWISVIYSFYRLVLWFFSGGHSDMTLVGLIKLFWKCHCDI